MLKTVAMILAGGEGRRLSILSQKRAKPAVPFAGKYRIIDFPLSNCVNSGIYNVGIATQYRPHSLHEHIRVGRPWDLDRATGGVTLLQPYLGRSNSGWYQGTADAIHQNFDFVRRYRPEDVLILAGDHVYKMNYDILLNFHREHEAECTIATRRVPLDEASRFGVMTVDEDYRVVEFEEKPSHPKSTLASMGIYVFELEALSRALYDDLEDPSSQRDFGKNIIPSMLAQGKRLYAFPYDGYWARSVHPAFLRRGYVINSFGPDHQANYVEHLPYIALHDPSWLPIGQPPWYQGKLTHYVDMLYDATNGTRSQGDLPRFGGDLGSVSATGN